MQLKSSTLSWAAGLFCCACGSPDSGAPGWSVDQGVPVDVGVPEAQVTHGMVRVPAGTFGWGCSPEQLEQESPILGSRDRRCKIDPEDFVLLDVPQRQVMLSEFWIDQYEATREEWDACVQAGVCEHTSLFSTPLPDYPNHPVSYITWEAAKTFCEWRGKRLPTEAEWEKAARGDDGRIFPWGNEDPTCDTANVLSVVYTDVSREDAERCNSREQEAVDAHPLDRSPYGVVGMYGNVQEWTADWADETYYDTAPSVDPPGPDQANTGLGPESDRIVRGSYFGTSSAFTFRRSWFDPAEAHTRIGFRCASSVEPSTIDDPTRG